MGSNLNDRSWNDPPFVKFESVTPVKKHQLLNKRSENETEGQSSTDKLFNEGKTESTPSCLSDNCTNTNIPHAKVSDEDTLLFVVSILQSALFDCMDKSQNHAKEITRRIGIMKESWNSKLSQEVKDKMYHLAQELAKDNIDTAWEVHCCIMVHNVREVKNWMVAVKHIIEMKRKKKLSQDDVEHAH